MPSPVAPTAAPADPAALVLTPSDVPAGFSPVESQPKNPDDVGTLAKDLGWQDGYVVRYASPAQDQWGPTEIIHSVAIYPAYNMPDIVALIDKQDRSDTDLTYRDMPLSGPGDLSRGFFGNASAQILAKPVETNPLFSGPDTHAGYAVFTRDVAEIIFSKGNILEVLRMTGPGADFETLRNLAQVAYNRIP